MEKSPFQALRRWLTMASAVGTFGLAACGPGPIVPPVQTNEKCESLLEVSPIQGLSPLEAAVKTDVKNKSKVSGNIQYGLDIMNTVNGDIIQTITSSTPINQTFTLTEDTDFRAYCTAGQEGLMAGPVHVDVIPNQAPIINLLADPDSGTSPLNSRIQYSCENPEGSGEIKKSYLSVGIDTIWANSVDSTFVFTETTPVRAYCEDSQTPVSDSLEVKVSQPPQPSANVDASIADKINIEYSLNKENSATGTFEVLRNGQVIRTETITEDAVTGTLSDSEIGNYSLIFTAGNIADTANVEVLNFPQYISNKSSLPTSFNEGSNTTINFEGKLNEINPEQMPVVVSGVRSLNPGKVNVSVVDDYNVRIEGIGDATGQYSFEVDISNKPGEIVTDTISGSIINLPRIQGQIRNTQTNTGQQGIVHFYNAADSTFLKADTSDTSGNFNVRLDQPVEDILMQSWLIPLEGSYVRTQRLQGEDTNVNPNVFAYRDVLSNAGVARDVFPNHASELNPNRLVTYVDSIAIIEEDPLGRGTLSRDFMNLAESKIESSTDVGCLVPGRSLYVQQDTIGTPESEKHYRIVPSGDGFRVMPDSGWAVVTRDTNLTSGGSTGRIDEYRFDIRLKNMNEAASAHELSHGLLASPFHDDALSETQSNMQSWAITRTTPGPADCELAHAFSNESYRVLPEESGLSYTIIEPYENIFGSQPLPMKMANPAPSTSSSIGASTDSYISFRQAPIRERKLLNPLTGRDMYSANAGSAAN